MKSKVKRKKVYFITVVIGFAICMVGVIFGSRLVFQRTCERRTTPWSDLGTADDDEYRILIDAYKIKNQSNETVMIQAFDNTKLIGHYVGTKIWGSFDLSDADACKALAHTDIPLLIIHGDEDMQAPLSMAYKLYDSCNGEKQLYIVHGADHSENYRKDPGGYEKIVTKFIEERIERKGD